MTALTAGQLLNLRDDHPHTKKTYLSPVLKVPILQAQVNKIGITVGEMTVPYDTGTGDAAEFALIEAGQTFVLGTTAGANDLGRGRVTSIAGNQVAGTMGASWNYDVEWANNAYLTIYLLYEPWPRFPRFTIAPEVFYKDYSITYTDENEDQQPVAIMGSGWAGWLGSGGTTVVTIDGRSSYTIAAGATIATYAWSVKHDTGGAPAIAAAAASNTTITFDTVGLYWVKLTVTDSNGKITWTTRPFMVHNTTTYPPVYLESASRTQNYEAGGVNLDFTTKEPATDSDIPDLHPVVLWSENYYDTSPIDVSYLNTFEYVDRTHVDFFGYIVKAKPTISILELGEVKFNAVTVEGRLRNKFEYPVSLIADPALTGVIDAWWKFPNDELTVARALHHLWEWHSTLHNVADVFYPTGDTRLRAGCEEFTEGSLYDRAASFSYTFGIFAKPVCNIYGALHIEIDVQFLDTADRAAITDIFTVGGKDWREGIDIDYKEGIDAAVVFTSGGKWDGNNFTPFCSEFGSVAANDGRKTMTADRLMVSSQANLNELTGRITAIMNHEIPGISLTMAGNWSSAIGIMPQQWVRLTLTGTEPGNKKGLVLTNIRAIPRSIQTSFNVNGQAGSITTITLQPEADGRDGQTRNCDFLSDAAPPEPPAPRWSLPASPALGEEGILGALMAFSSGYYRDDNATSWTELVTDTLLHGNVDPFWRIKQATNNPISVIWWTVAAGIVARYVTTTGLKHVISFGDPPNTWSDGVAPTEFTVDQFQIVGDFWETGRHYVLARWQEAGGLWRGWLAHTADDGTTWAWIPLYDGAQPDEVRPLWVAVNGTHVLVTVWQDDGVGGTTLILLRYTKSTMAYNAEYSLGTCTSAQIEDKTYVAYVATVLDDDNDWFVYGRMNAPQALANPEHVIKTENAGGAWASIKNTWLSNICMSFFAGLDDGGNRIYMAVKGAP